MGLGLSDVANRSSPLVGPIHSIEVRRASEQSKAWPHALDVAGQCDEAPFAADLVEAAQRELPKAEH
jgi:hypothetical protein